MAKKAGKSVVKKKPKAKVTASASKRKLVAEMHPKSLIVLPSVWSLTKSSAITLWDYRQLFGGITLIYGLLNLVLVQGLASSGDVNNLKTNLNQLFGGHFGALGSSLSGFTMLASSSGNGSSQTAGAYQLFLALITSLAVIWALRQIFSNSQPRISDAYYRGMYPLIPFLLVLIIIGLQLIPLVLGAGLYSLVISNGIAVHFIEKFLFGLVFVILGAWSIYMLSSSIFGLYVATLPDMTPLKALRSAKQLVQKRRWAVILRLVWLPVVLLAASAIIMLPIIAWLTPLAQWIFFLLTMFGLVVVHTYMYGLYRELLNE
jgi:hypothetical protein